MKKKIKNIQNDFHRASKTGMLQPYMKQGFWSNPKNQYWETEMYTKKGKEYCRNFIKKLEETKIIKPEQNGKPLNRKHM
jgi:hypothetical protein